MNPLLYCISQGCARPGVHFGSAPIQHPTPRPGPRPIRPDQLFLQQFFFLQQMADMDVAIYINCKRQRSPDAERPVGSGLRTPENLKSKKARMPVRIYINGDEQLAESTSPVSVTPAGPEPQPTTPPQCVP